jgi:hypothetical protein
VFDNFGSYRKEYYILVTVNNINLEFVEHLSGCQCPKGPAALNFCLTVVHVMILVVPKLAYSGS